MRGTEGGRVDEFQRWAVSHQTRLLIYRRTNERRRGPNSVKDTSREQQGKQINEQVRLAIYNR